MFCSIQVLAVECPRINDISDEYVIPFFTGPAKLVDVYIDLRRLAEEHIRVRLRHHLESLVNLQVHMPYLTQFFIISSPLTKFTLSVLQGFTEPISDKLLPDLHPMEQHVFTLVLDLTETLIYSDWKVVSLPIILFWINSNEPKFSFLYWLVWCHWARSIYQLFVSCP